MAVAAKMLLKMSADQAASIAQLLRGRNTEHQASSPMSRPASGRTSTSPRGAR